MPTDMLQPAAILFVPGLFCDLSFQVCSSVKVHLDVAFELDAIFLQALGRTNVVPGNGSQYLRGVFTLEPEAVLSGPATVFLEAQHPSITLNFDQPPKAFLASDLSNAAITPNITDGLLDKYRPCSIDPLHGYVFISDL